MTTILAAAASGMVHNQMVLDTVGDNLANVQSAAFKRTRIVAEGRPDATRTPEMSRLGVSESTLDPIFEVGSAQMTGDELHFMLNDDSFFRVRDFDGGVAYTRLGKLSADYLGQITAFRGRELDPPIVTEPGMTAFAVDANGVLTGRTQDGTIETLGQIGLVRFMNPAGLDSLGDGLYRESVNSGATTEGFPGDGAFATVTPGALEASNVDMAHEFTEMILAQRAYQASVRAFSVGDSMLATATDLTR